MNRRLACGAIVLSVVSACSLSSFYRLVGRTFAGIFSSLKPLVEVLF